MSAFEDVVSALDMLVKSVENVQKIAEAIKSGVDYVKQAHPEARSDLIAMSREMANTLDALAVASSVVTRFGFTVEGEDLDKQPGRFNDYYQKKVLEENALERQIETLRGHCHIIRDHAEDLSKLASNNGLHSLFNLLGVSSSEKETELAERLNDIYNEEMEISLTVNTTSRAVKQAMEDIQNALGGASMSPANVPKAAALLQKYRDHFNVLQSHCLEAAGDLKIMIHDLAD
jgi:methyl-accepting chemotaxis protein